MRTMLGLRETGMELKWIDTRIKKEKKKALLNQTGGAKREYQTSRGGYTKLKRNQK